ncbi:MAG: hypothetical protein LBD53_05650 [Tannerella sp.]|jgi:hypothetical protein|nr:hypothetical protein [Tannerella sp.]
MDNLIRYLICFLTGNDVPTSITDRIRYTHNTDIPDGEKLIIIIPSDFFDKSIFLTDRSLPSLPLADFMDAPLLFGKPVIERKNETVIIHADIIASAFFLMSRYEEVVNRNIRDAHGRFPGRMSLPCRAGFMQRPIVDEYRLILRKILKDSGFDIKEQPQQISKTYLTHDIDSPFAVRTWRNVARYVIKEHENLFDMIRLKMSNMDNDMFVRAQKWLYNQDNEFCKTFDNHEIITFIRSAGKAVEDKPYYFRYKKQIEYIVNQALNNNSIIGLHSSYHAGIDMRSRLKDEKDALLGFFDNGINANFGINAKKEIIYHRSHYLSAREPEDMEVLSDCDFVHDFTMGYADTAGFRLGTSHPVRYINPVSMKISQPVLHPLTVMDSTLSSTDYMGLDEEEAEDYCTSMLKNVKKHNGEITLLWHNTSVADNASSYHKSLYPKLLNIIKTL